MLSAQPALTTSCCVILMSLRGSMASLFGGPPQSTPDPFPFNHYCKSWKSLCQLPSQKLWPWSGQWNIGGNDLGASRKFSLLETRGKQFWSMNLPLCTLYFFNPAITSHSTLCFLLWMKIILREISAVLQDETIDMKMKIKDVEAVRNSPSPK